MGAGIFVPISQLRRMKPLDFNGKTYVPAHCSLLSVQAVGLAQGRTRLPWAPGRPGERGLGLDSPGRGAASAQGGGRA